MYVLKKTFIKLNFNKKLHTIYYKFTKINIENTKSIL